MPDVVLATLNAKYLHASFGLRYLMANLGDLAPRAAMLEFDINQRPADIVEAILAQRPRIVGLGVYVWNVTPTTEIVAMLKRIAPEIVVIVGGPEVSHEIEEQAICRMADFVITDEADFTLPELLRGLLGSARVPRADAGVPPASSEGPEAGRLGEHAGRVRSPDAKPVIVRSPPVDVRKLALPYALYDAKDIAHRLIYVEASRGCPFTCEFCLSSLDVPLRRFPLDTLLPALQDLLDRGVRHFKFVDRTFNLSIAYSLQLLEFFLQRHEAGLFLHFEMIPDRLPAELKQILTHFPRGSLQFEVGIQTFNLAVAERIKRRQDYAKSEDNIRFLLKETGAHIHADLIYGLPGESLDSFVAGFDRLLALGPQEIQVNLLKRLRGTPISRHDAEWQMVYSPEPPYELLRNRDLDFPTIQRLRRFARYWDMIGNSGHFLETCALVFKAAPSPFQRLMAFSDWMFATHGRAHGLGLDFLAQQVLAFATQHASIPEGETGPALLRDLLRGGRRDIPIFLRGWADGATSIPSAGKRDAPKRQARHLA